MKFYQTFLRLVLGSGLLGLCAVCADAKPLSPVQVSIAPYSIQGEAIEFVVRATVAVDTDDLQITVTLPQQLEVVGGDLQWRGPLFRGEEKWLRFTVSAASFHNLASGEQAIQARAIIRGIIQGADSQRLDRHNAGGTQLSASAAYALVSGIAGASAKPQQASGSRVVERYGRKIQEYELRP